MNVVIDSYGLLGAIGRHRQAFSAIDELVKKQAAALLTAQLKHKTLDLALYRAIVAAIGTEPFELFLDTADDKLLKSMAKKLDPHAGVSKTGDSDALRPHLVDLAKKTIEPAAKPVRASRGARTTASTAGNAERTGTGLHAIATKPPGRR
jgi:hypothetical protein